MKRDNKALWERGGQKEQEMANVAEKTRTISVKQLHPVIGAEIRGVDLSRPLDD
jgi:hypothetical protein